MSTSTALATYPRGGLGFLLRTYGASRRNAEALGGSPIEFFLQISQGGGLAFRDIITYPFFERFPVYLINDPESVRRVLTSPAETCTKEGTRLFEVGGRVWGQGLFTIEGQLHHQHRPDIHRLFRQTLGGQGVERAVLSRVQEMMTRWQERGGRIIDVQQDLLDLSLAILCDVFIGDVPPDERRVLAQLVAAVQGPLGQLLGATVVLPAWVPLPANRQLQRLVVELRDVLAGIVRKREAPHEAARDQTLLDRLLLARYDHQYIYDELATLLFGGFRTTAAWMVWVLYLLSQHTDAERQVREELVSTLGNSSPGAGDLPRLGYLDLVLKEALRLYPPTWIMDRRACVATTLCGVPIAQGSLLIICPYTLHRHPAYWERPNDFYPEHFHPEHVARRHRCAFVPFGAGPHVCIGQPFAERVTRQVLSIVLQHYVLTLDPPDFRVELAAQDALFAQNGMPMRLSARTALGNLPAPDPPESGGISQGDLP